jgi:short-subunit dehydrogenase involved in D-alanine esterification of teichoic acids
MSPAVTISANRSGIGLETARRARAAGANVILTGRNPKRLRQAAAELDARRTAAFDASDPTSLQCHPTLTRPAIWTSPMKHAESSSPGEFKSF